MVKSACNARLTCVYSYGIHSNFFHVVDRASDFSLAARGLGVEPGEFGADVLPFGQQLRLGCVFCYQISLQST